MRQKIHRTTLAAALLLCLATAGCGRSFTIPWLGYRADVPEAPYASESLYPAGIDTVYVQGFDNVTWRQGLEVDLTRAIAREITQKTSLRLAARDRADSILSGRLVEFEESAEVRNTEDRILLKEVRLTVEFRWRDRLTGADIVPPRTVSESVRTTPAEITDGYTFQEVAQRVAQAMESDW
jgi:ABC-type amino acid transport substrate-binding protein